MSDDAMMDDEDFVGQHDVCIEFESESGNKIVCPSRWSFEDNGNSFSLTSQDEQATIEVLTFTIEGTGTYSEFLEIVASWLEGEWHDSTWTDIEIGRVIGKKKVFNPVDDDADFSWLAYALVSGDYYHAILVSASPLVMSLNGGFYENLVQSFVPLS